MNRELELPVEDLYNRFGPMVFRRCRFLLKDEQKAMDAMQDVFARLLRYRARLSGENPAGLLFQMATRVCLNLIRSQRSAETVTGDDLLIRIATYDRHEDRMVVRDFLDRIFQKEKESTREIAVMHYVDGMTLQEISRETRLSLSGIGKRIRILKGRIRAYEENVHGR